MEAGPRWLAYLATLVVVGAGVFRFGVIRPLVRSGFALPSDTERRAAGIALVSALVLAVALGFKLFAQAANFVEPGEAVSLQLIGTVLDTAWGRGWIVQVLAAGLAASGALFARVAPAGWLSGAAGATAVVLAAPLTGHAIGAEQAGRWAYPLDALHVFGAGAWLGTLLVVLLAGVPSTVRLEESERSAAVARLIHAFHPVALVAGGTTILAGLGLSLLYTSGDVSALWNSGWGRSLGLKLILLGVVGGLGAWNWRVLRPRLGSTEAANRITRSAWLELTVATALLAVTAVLVARPLPGEE